MEDTRSGSLSFLKLTKDQTGLILQPGTDLLSCCQNGLALARHYLQAFGFPLTTARIVYGSWYDNSFSPLMPGVEANPKTDYPVLMLEHIGVFPLSTARTRWVVVNPLWYYMPDVVNENETVLPFYNLKSYDCKEYAAQSYLLAVQSAVQNYLYDEICREFQGALLQYQEAFNAESVTDEREFEFQCLVQPAILMLIDRLPFVGGSRPVEFTQVTYVSRTLTSKRLQVIQNLLYNGYEFRWRVEQSWLRLNPVIPQQTPTAQMLAQRNFASVFHHVLPLILAHRIREIDKILVDAKRGLLG